jgi:hypothetical protein
MDIGRILITGLLSILGIIFLFVILPERWIDIVAIGIRRIFRKK